MSVIYFGHLLPRYLHKAFTREFETWWLVSFFVVFMLSCLFNLGKVFVVTKTRGKLTLNAVAEEQASSENNQLHRQAFLRRAYTTATKNVGLIEWGLGCVNVTFNRQLIFSVSLADSLGTVLSSAFS